MILSDLVSAFENLERGAAVILSSEQVTALAVASVRLFAGYSDLENHMGATDDVVASLGAEDIHVTVSEWCLIRPLFMLYVERESALQMEATGMQGVNGYGRSSAELGVEINQFEKDLQQWASSSVAFTIGGESMLSDNSHKDLVYGWADTNF